MTKCRVRNRVAGSQKEIKNYGGKGIFLKEYIEFLVLDYPKEYS